MLKARKELAARLGHLPCAERTAPFNPADGKGHLGAVGPGLLRKSSTKSFPTHLLGGHTLWKTRYFRCKQRRYCMNA